MLARPAIAPPEGFVRTPADLLGQVVRHPGPPAVDLHPGPCTLDPSAVDLARLHPAGGVLRCADCGRPVFLPPATCLERVEDDLEEIDGGVVARRP